MQYRLVSGFNIDDFLIDWSKFCQYKNMVFASDMNPTAHCYQVISENTSINIYIDQPVCETNTELLDLYLEDLTKRHIEVHIDIMDSLAELQNKTNFEEDTIGIAFLNTD